MADKAERPILFSAPMVLALLDGRKTQTRRILKPQPDTVASPRGVYVNTTPGRSKLIRCPYGVPGDRLWVRETLRRSEVGPWVYRADDEPVAMRQGDPRITEMVAWAHHKEGDTCVSIHMPRWASRITLEITNVRVERLNDISEADARAEGCPVTWDGHPYDPPPPEVDSWQGYGRYSYCLLWNQINGPGSWDANPWVWAVSFERVA